MTLQESLVAALTDLNEEEAIRYAKKLVEEGYSYESIQMCMNNGVAMVGKLFEKGEYFIADLIVSGMIYRDVLQAVMPAGNGGHAMPVGRVVIGVVEGDIHDIGKDIVVSLLRAEKFEVIDLGVDVRPERFLYAVRTYKPDILLLSGCLNFAAPSMSEVMKKIQETGLRDQVAILIGGSCASGNLQRSIGADGWAYDPTETVKFCKKVIEEKHEKC